MAQPSTKGKETAAPEDDDVEFPQHLFQPTSRQFFLPSSNMELGESSTSRNRNDVPTQNTYVSLESSVRGIGQSSRNARVRPERARSQQNSSYMSLGPSRRAVAQRRRRSREQVAPYPTMSTLLEDGSATEQNEIIGGFEEDEFHLSDIDNHRSMRAIGQLRRHARVRDEQARNQQNSSNISSGPSRRPVAQRRRQLREQVAPYPTMSTILEDASTTEQNENIGGFEEDEFDLPGGIENQQIFNHVRHSLGRMDVICQHCHALHWIGEKLVKSSVRSPRFGTCCLDGQVRLPNLLNPPPLFSKLYDGTDNRSTSFFRDIRQYNAANAFTSLGCSLDDRVRPGRGPYSFTIHGELRHCSGSLLPHIDTNPRYAQLYIYDPMAALDFRQRRNPTLNRDLMANIQECLLQYNPFAPIFRQACAILEQQSQYQPNQNLPAYLRYDPRADQRRYNAPTVDEIAVILPGDGTERRRTRDIVLHYKATQGLERISESHPAYAPLHYVLLFPLGELGWEPSMTLWDVNRNGPSTRSRNRLTMMDYYSYRLFERPTEYSTILRGKKLFQEYLVDAWAATEQNRLRYIRENQEEYVRVDRYKDLQEIFDEESARPDQIGRRFVLPSSFTGGPRQMYEIFQDSMAITRAYKHPDIFLTMTANPAWPEIKDALLPNQTAADRPDLVARVFELKRKHLLKIVKDRRVFGKIEAYVFTIEFQKRGLPHMHALFFLADEDKIRTPEQVDRVVCAELPDPDNKPALFDTVKRCMIHGPCGTRNPGAQCMENNMCKKRFPKQWAETTIIDNDGYAIYRRRNNGVVLTVREKEIDHRDVVPYNPYLTELFDCHINVEVCAGVRCVKYIHKYIYKGHDRTTMVLGKGDEIKQYLDARYIGPPEAAWRLFGNTMHEEFPNVVRLDLHLPGEHNVSYDSRCSRGEIVQQAREKVTKLMGFFRCCASDEMARNYTYQQMPKHYTWKDNFWKRRHPNRPSQAIGRIYFASPSSGERFYLRLLLITVKGPTSWENLRTYNGVVCDTFKEACIARGLLEDDEEWKQCMEEASVMKTGYQLRRLFALILTQCSPIYPHELWTRFAMSICDDLPHKLRTQYKIPYPNDSQITDYGLHLLNEILQESGKSLEDFPPMPLPHQNWTQMTGNNRLLWEHRQLMYDDRTTGAEANISRLNVGQRHCFDAVMSSVNENRGKTFFLNGGAGTGKTFLYNTIAGVCRSLDNIVICVASSGIASLLLAGGRTAHSTFCLPLNVLEDTLCSFTKQSIHAHLFKETKLIIWDEVPMQHRHCVEAVDRSLRDVRDNDSPFGGITVVFGGDFRQTLPVVPKGYREQIVGSTIQKSPLWNNIHVLTLSENMRLDRNDFANVEFATYLNEVGTTPNETIELPSTIRKCKDVKELIGEVYPSLHIPRSSARFLTDRTILSPRNDDVNYINHKALEIFPGEIISYLSADKYADDDASDSIVANRYPIEYLNSLNPPGLPPSDLQLKVGCPVILMRNLAPRDGLCNGTRLRVVRCGRRIIEAEILTGDKAGNLVFIPRISLTPSSTELIIPITRRQFPIRLCFAMTINKSQGQSVKFVGIDLRTPVFTHGQLYVALSRCTTFDRITLLLPSKDDTSTTNIVYPEVLL